MRTYCLVIIIILISCKSVELKQPVWYFWPIKLHLGTDISLISEQLRMDTTKYSKVRFAKHLIAYKLERQDLDKLNFNNNYADSIKLYFYKNKLFSLDIFASGNREVEYLKFDIRGQKESSLGLGSGINDTTFNYGKYKELRYNSIDGHMWFDYLENIVDNTAVLSITNKNMLKTMPPRKPIH
jgi:hypothetical protein